MLRGKGYKIFSYLRDYEFKVQSSYTFKVEEGKTSLIRVVVDSLGGLRKFVERPTVQYRGAQDLVRGGVTVLLVPTAWVGLTGLLLPSAAASSFDATIDGVAARSSELSERVDELEAQTKPGAYLTAREAQGRFQDCLYAHLVGQHVRAAEGFFSLVTTGTLTDAGLQRDAEWYLGESLFAMGNFRSAEQVFTTIIDDPYHPFRDDGVRRLLELYADANDEASFRALYQREILAGKVRPSARITYSLARSFHRQGDAENARAYFERLEPGSDWYARGRYFLGTMAVEDGDLATASEHFSEVLELPIATDTDQRVHDLSLLAMGAHSLPPRGVLRGGRVLRPGAVRQRVCGREALRDVVDLDSSGTLA